MTENELRERVFDLAAGSNIKIGQLTKIIDLIKFSGEPPTLEERVEKIERWIDFWETVETPWDPREKHNEKS